ncbi:MAG TPA: hypothetical protein VNQ81_16880 [Povalibacter sp.]|nr:hypothetical protein [Povalibacter sp.]
MLTSLRIAGVLFGLAFLAPASAEAATYEARYRAQVLPEAGKVHVELKLTGTKLPSKIVLRIDPHRHLSFASTDPFEVKDSQVTWRPRGKFSRLSYDFVVNHERSPGRYDSLMTKDWALFRGDKLVPRATVTSVKGLEARTTLEFVLPETWTAITPYAPASNGALPIDDPKRRFDRPTGWMLVGKLGNRGERIAGIQTIVAAPAGDSVRRQDMLSFLNWNLPQLANVFATFPKRLLIVSAGDPMWRGGLSGPGSLFLHADRPLISENRTSTLLHELVHVAMGIRGDHESDWIVEGFAEFYSIETLRRSGGISKQRYEEAMQRLGDWGKRTPDLFAKRSSGAQTARAVVVLKEADQEIRKLTQGRASLDDVAGELAKRRGEVSLELLQSIAKQVAGKPLQSLERQRLSGVHD